MIPWRWQCSLLVLVLIAGCDKSRPPTVSVRGRVTLDGGAWPASGRLYFAPVEPAPGFPGRSGTAEFGADGQFSAGTWAAGDGLMPGKYKVGIECWKALPLMDGPAPVSYVADSHVAAAGSPLELVVEQSRPISDIDWRIPRNPAAK